MKHAEIPPVPVKTSEYLPKGSAYIIDTRFFKYGFGRAASKDYPEKLHGETKDQYDARIVEWMALNGRAVVIKGIGT